MTRAQLAAGLALAALCAAAMAQDRAGAAAPGDETAVLQPLHQGYDFDTPAILVRQRLFGLAHGLSLLAGACLDVPDQAASAQEAYATWHARQAAAIRGMSESLAAYYFGARAGEATWSDLARALNLRQDIREALGDVKLEEACQTLPTVLVGPRYAFDRLLADAESTGDEAKVGAGTTAPLTPPAPNSSAKATAFRPANAPDAVAPAPAPAGSEVPRQ